MENIYFLFSVNKENSIAAFETKELAECAATYLNMTDDTLYAVSPPIPFYPADMSLYNIRDDLKERIDGK